MARISSIFLLCFVLVQISVAARIKRQDGDIAFPGDAGDVDIDDRYAGAQNPGNFGNQGGRPGQGWPGQQGGGRPGQNQQGGGRPGLNQQGGGWPGQNQQGGRPGQNQQGGGRPGQNQQGGGFPGQGQNQQGGGRPGQNQQGGGRPQQQQQSTTRRPATTPAGETATADPNCERRCLRTPEYNPVCGSNRVSYPNIGSLECARRCGLPDLQFMRLGNCPPAAAAT